MNASIERRWQRARGYLGQQNFPAACAQLESMFALAPGDARTCLLAARIAMHSGLPRDAAACARDAAKAVGGDIELLVDLVETLLQVGESAAAHALLVRPGWDAIQDPELMLRHADQQRRLAQHPQALAAFERVLALRPHDGKLHRYRGQQLEFLGRIDEAEDAYIQCLTRDPGYAHAAYSLVRLRRQTHHDNHLALVESCMRHVPRGSQQHADFEFARYHVLEDLGELDAAWRALSGANAQMHAFAAADAERERQGLAAFCEVVATSPPQEATAQAGGPCPIFILGLPRSGTTVLDRMLANHSRATSAGELTDFGRQLLRVGNSPSGWDRDFFTRQLALDLGEVGRGYLAQTQWRAGDKPFYIDKRPGNYMVAGLIHAALPKAKILHLVRDPMDACFSIWRARFGSTYSWSYDFAALAAHYQQYRQLMDIWHSAFPGAIMDVAYADLVHDPVTTLGRVLDFCGLAAEPGCEDLTRNTGPVSTLSAAQVREPLHARALGHWHRYERQLEPLRQLLSRVP